MIQISLRIRAVWSESSLGGFCLAEDTKFLHADTLMRLRECASWSVSALDAREILKEMVCHGSHKYCSYMQQSVLTYSTLSLRVVQVSNGYNQSLIGVFFVSVKTIWIFTCPQRALRRLWSDCTAGRTSNVVGNTKTSFVLSHHLITTLYQSCNTNAV